MNETNFLKIDGSFGEGGGAILRLSAGLSVLFNRPIIIKNIRANRPKPGLRTQHLLGLKTLAEITNSSLSNCKVGTKEITFIPNKENVNDKISVNISTAASIGLLLQPIQIACLGFTKPEKIEISLSGGGTHGKWAPSINYLKLVTYQIFKNLGFRIEVDIKKYGFYPKGGAYIKCILYPPKQRLKPINLQVLGNVDLIQGKIIITNQLRRQRDNIGIRIRKSIKKQIKRTLDVETDVNYEWVDSTSPGVGLSLWAHSDTGSIISTGTLLGEKHISSEKLGLMAANKILKYIQNEIPVDNYLSDQLIPLMAFVKKPSKIRVFEITSHTKTNLELIKLFINRNYVISRDKNHFIIEYK
ncbi:MAG: RNA 3'-terminal phosphate cyclase [Promethearchaeota archaeon]